jgi:hypothetical protein
MNVGSAKHGKGKKVVDDAGHQFRTAEYGGWFSR